MFTFSEYIVEAKSKKDKAPAIPKYNEADMKGKLFEVLTGSFLKHGENKKTGLPKQFLTHYRDAETQQTPESFHEFAKNIMHGNSDVIVKGSRKPSRVQRQHIYNEVLQHAKEAADHIKKQLAEHGHTDVNDVVWSSLADRLGKNGEKIPGDHQKFTGVHDPNSDADVMLKTKHKDGSDRYVGISLKYGEQKNPNLRNNGLENWEKEAGLKKESLLNPSRETREAIRKYIPNHEEYKRLNELRDSGKITPSDKRKLEKAEGLMSNLQNNTAKQIVSGLQSKSGQDLLEMARRHISPQTKFEHFRHHAFVSGKENPDGVRSAAHHFTQTQDAVDNTINDFDPKTVNAIGGSGISFGVYGKRRGSNSEEPIITYGVKKSHGLHSGINTTANAPSLTKPVLNKPAEKVVVGSGTEKISEPVVGTPAGIIKRKLGEVKPSIPAQQRRVPQTGSPLQTMARPGVSRTIPKPIHYRDIDENINESFLREAKEQNLPHINDWMAARDNEHLSNKVDTAEYYKEVGKKINTASKSDRSDRGWSIADFTMNSRPINKHLIATNNQPNEKLTLSQREKIPHLDSFIQDNKIPHDVTTYSAVGFDPRKKIVDGSMDSPAYISTTPDKLIAKDYIDRGSKARQKAKHFISFNLKKGQLAANITNHSSTDNGYGTGGKNFRPHNEVLIGRGARLHYSHTDSYQDPKTGTTFHVHHMSVTHGDVDPSVKLLPPPSQRVAPNGYPEHMHQAHKDNSVGGFQDNTQ